MGESDVNGGGFGGRGCAPQKTISANVLAPRSKWVCSHFRMFDFGCGPRGFDWTLDVQNTFVDWASLLVGKNSMLYCLMLTGSAHTFSVISSLHALPGPTQPTMRKCFHGFLISL